MAKKAKKSIKKAFKSAVKKTHHTAKKVVEKESKIRKHLESLRMQRRDAATIWEEINEDHSDEEIRELVRNHNFGTLLGEIS